MKRPNPWTSDFDNADEFWRIADALAPDGFTDFTYGNDLCPSLGIEIRPDEFIRVWVDYADPSQRELPIPRLGVEFEEGKPRRLWQGESVEEAIRVARQFVRDC